MSADSKLTAEERACLDYGLRAKALRIIDALAAENKRLHSERAEYRDRTVVAEAELAAAESRLATAEAENERLRAESEARRTTLLAKADELAAEWRRAEAAESRLATAEAENERLRAELAHITGLLDAANATLESPSHRELAAEAHLATLTAENERLRADSATWEHGFNFARAECNTAEARTELSRADRAALVEQAALRERVDSARREWWVGKTGRNHTHDVAKQAMLDAWDRADTVQWSAGPHIEADLSSTHRNGQPVRSPIAREMLDQLHYQGACNTQEDDLERWAFTADALAEAAARAEAAESRLATAVGLLRTAPVADTGYGPISVYLDWLDRRVAFLASAQPAAPARAEAEQAVLDALCSPDDCDWTEYDSITHTQAELLNAAIKARREAAKW